MGFPAPHSVSPIEQDELTELIPGGLWKEVSKWIAEDRRDIKHPRHSCRLGRGHPRSKGEAEHRSKKRWQDPRRLVRAEEDWIDKILLIAA